MMKTQINYTGHTQNNISTEVNEITPEKRVCPIHGTLENNNEILFRA